MRHKRAFVALFVAFIAAGYLSAQEDTGQQKPIPDRDIGLSRSSVFDVADPAVFHEEASDPGEKPVIPRAHIEAPPLVPHNVTEFLPITWEVNLCIECHLADEAGRSDGKPIPASHLTDLRNAPGEIGTSVVGARQVCVSCHVAQTDAEPLVGNLFRR